MVNDKIYIFLWFWLLILLTISLSYFVFRMITVLSPRVRMFQLLTFAPSIPNKTAEYLQDALGFGDWLILSMMADHLDIKIFNDILQQIMTVNFEEKRLLSMRYSLDNIHRTNDSVFSTATMMSTIEMNGVSDTEGEDNDEVKEPLRASPLTTPASARKISAPILKKVFN